MYRLWLLPFAQINVIVLHDCIITFLFLLLIFVIVAEVLTEDGHMDHINSDINI